MSETPTVERDDDPLALLDEPAGRIGARGWIGLAVVAVLVVAGATLLLGGTATGPECVPAVGGAVTPGPCVEQPGTAPPPPPTAGPAPTGGPAKDTSPAQLRIPPVAGLSEGDARSALDGFRVTTAEEQSEEVAAGKAVRTDPAAGQSRDRNARVTLFLSSGPAPPSVPDVRNQDETTAVQTLAAAGFTLVNAGTTSTDMAELDGLVASQSPRAGAGAPLHSPVEVVLYRYVPTP